MVKSNRKNYTTIKQLIKRFDKVAAQYDVERTAIGYRIRHFLIKSLLRELYKCNNLGLDVGCGTGEYTILMEQMGFTVTGVDVSKGMLRVARAKQRKVCRSDRLQLVRAEGSRLPFKECIFDVVICIAVLDIIPFYKKLLKEISWVLKGSGKLILCIDSLWSPSRIWTGVRDLVRRRNKSKRVPDRLHYKSLTKSMKTEGFIIEKVLGDFLMGQVLTPFLFDPQRKNVAKKLVKVIQPLNGYLTRMELLKLFSAHYIIQARKGDKKEA